MMDDEGFEPIADTLACPPIQIDDRTTPDSIEAELRERLEALLASHTWSRPLRGGAT